MDRGTKDLGCSLCPASGWPWATRPQDGQIKGVSLGGCRASWGRGGGPVALSGNMCGARALGGGVKAKTRIPLSQQALPCRVDTGCPANSLPLCWPHLLLPFQSHHLLPSPPCPLLLLLLSQQFPSSLTLLPLSLWASVCLGASSHIGCLTPQHPASGSREARWGTPSSPWDGGALGWAGPQSCAGRRPAQQAGLRSC